MSSNTTNSAIEAIRIAAENDLVKFIELVAPHRMLGDIHRELCAWYDSPNAKNHQLTLLPRDHMKSAIMGYRAAREICRNPSVRILYISSTANLAEKQLKFIKDIIEGDIVRRYWPNLVNKDEGKREKWTNAEISVDHPKRKEEGIRDPTVFTGGLTTSLTGLHCDIAILDDVVVQENAYTNEGRTKVKTQYSLLASIEGAEAKEWVVGTRYNTKDLYDSMLNMEEEIFNENGEIIGKEKVYEVFERQVEDRGDGTGNFLWPRAKRADGKYFGFDAQVLAVKRAKYLDTTQYRAQYYNDPNSYGSSGIDRGMFRYITTEQLSLAHGTWNVQGVPIRLIASIDFAFSTAKKADYTSLVVIGADLNGMYYVLDIQRLKTNKIEEYYAAILNAYNLWGFKQIVMECNVAQEAIVDQLKSHYIDRDVLPLSIIKVRPNRHEGTKQERMAAVLTHRYREGLIWHVRQGTINDLEEELLSENPPHDDIKNALAEAIANIKVPTRNALAAYSETSLARFGDTRLRGFNNNANVIRPQANNIRRGY